MKETKLYTCEFCGTAYKDKARCQECEENHSKPVKIVDAAYASFKSDQSGYPKYIVVEMEDGEEVEYRRY